MHRFRTQLAGSGIGLYRPNKNVGRSVQAEITAARPASSRATGTRNGEQDT